MLNKTNISIIGCGNGGQALAAHLSMMGCNVTLYAHPEHQSGLKNIKRTGMIHCKGQLNGSIPITSVTTDIDKAVSTADIIFISLPSYAHESVFEEMIPYLVDGQIIGTLAANFASLCFHDQLLRSSHKARVTLVDFDSLPYACRADNQGTVKIMAIKKQLSMAVFPEERQHQTAQVINSVFPVPVSLCDSVIRLGLNITSGISHPLTTLFNAGRIGKEKEDFYFYKEGISETTARLLSLLDKERQYIGKLYGFDLPAYVDLMNHYYGRRYQSIYHFFLETEAHNRQKLCPQSLQHRYIEQDVPFVLVPWYSLGKAANHDSKVMRSIIEMSSLVNGKNYFTSGRNLENLILKPAVSTLAKKAS